MWAERGWITPGAETAILEHAASSERTHSFTLAVGILGVVLLGTGVITFFAANWDQMAKLSKLLLLFGSLWLSYGAAAYLRIAAGLPHIAEAVLLLGVILFGANIMLIAQIYHIDEHYPNGVLLWAIGGLLTAILLHSQSAMVAALLLGTLWTLIEGFEFLDGIHWWYLAFAGISALLIEQRRWGLAAHWLWIGLMLWAVHVYALDDPNPRSIVYLTQFYLVLALSLYLGGGLLRLKQDTTTLAGPLQRYALLGGLITFFLLTIPDLQEGIGLGPPVRDNAGAAGTRWLLLTLPAVTLLVLLAGWHQKVTGPRHDTGRLWWGLPLLAALLVVLVANLFLDSSFGGLIAIGFNLLYFAALVWLVLAGLEIHDSRLVNLAFGFFVVALIARYFDTFWSLMDRSLFFMGGGAILLIGGFFLERKRRRLARQIARERAEAAP